MVKNVRRNLDDDADNPRHIFAEPRVGYRMAEGGDAVRVGSQWRDAPYVPSSLRVTPQESRGLGASTGYRATSRKWWYLP